LAATSARAISRFDVWAAQSSGEEPSPDLDVHVGAGFDERPDGLRVAGVDRLHQGTVAAGRRHGGDHRRGQ
jgi:hypothetical protein